MLLRPRLVRYHSLLGYCTCYWLYRLSFEMKRIFSRTTYFSLLLSLVNMSVRCNRRIHIVSMNHCWSSQEIVSWDSVGVLGMGVPRPACLSPGLAHFIKQANGSGITQGKALVRGQASRGGTISRLAGGLIRTPPERRIF
ncbi:hypothetical protein D1007_26674 [Hordeum vulgare]|nr:hypothetical protein D1007_26674 [Hordeum vulgare]